MILIAIASWLWHDRAHKKVSNQLRENASEIDKIIASVPELKQSLGADPEIAEALKTMKGK